MPKNPFEFDIQQITLRPDPNSVLVVRIDESQWTAEDMEELCAQLNNLRPPGAIWRYFQIPVIILSEDTRLEQLDAEDMKKAGWIRAEVEPHE